VRSGGIQRGFRGISGDIGGASKVTFVSETAQVELWKGTSVSPCREGDDGGGGVSGHLAQRDVRRRRRLTRLAVRKVGRCRALGNTPHTSALLE